MTTNYDDLRTFGEQFPPDPKKRKILRDTDGNIDGVQTIMAATLVVAVLFFAYLLWLSFIEANPPMTVTKTEITIDTTEQGGFVEYIFGFCKHTDVAVDRRRSLVDGTSRILISDPPPYVTGGRCYEFQNEIDIPLDTLPGENYYILTSYTYNVNHFAQHSVETTVGPFTVTEALDG